MTYIYYFIFILKSSYCCIFAVSFCCYRFWTHEVRSSLVTCELRITKILLPLINSCRFLSDLVSAAVPSLASSTILARIPFSCKLYNSRSSFRHSLVSSGSPRRKHVSLDCCVVFIKSYTNSTSKSISSRISFKMFFPIISNARNIPPVNKINNFNEWFKINIGRSCCQNGRI